MAVFFAVILLVIVLIHLYLYKRLVLDPLRPGRWRRVGTVIAAGLMLLVPATLIGVRAGHVKWLAWPGYLWIALMFYLLITLLVLEIPRLVVRLAWVRRGRAGKLAEEKRSGGAAVSGSQVAGAAPAAGSQKPVLAGAGTGSETPALAGAGTGSETPALAGAEIGTETPALAGTATGGGSPGRVRGVSDTIAESAAVAAGTTSPDRADGGVDRRLVLARGAAIFAGLTAASVTGFGIRTATGAPRIDRVRLPIAKLPRAMDGTRLAVVSDIHLGPLTGIGHTERITRVINSVDADLVCVVGDLVDGSVAELGRLAEPLRGIESRHGAYFVTGNHEYYSGYQQWIDEVAELGMRPLRNERVAIEGLDLAGVNDLGGEEHGDPADFGKALGDRDTSRPVVLMAHQPLAAKQAAPYGVDLQVSGHTHGGQMAPFNLLVKLQQPVVSGFGRVDGVPVYVTNGAGFWGPPVRVGAPPQVTVVELRVA
ncbi:metallophosphoesterase [Actinoplanes oblitus]|uniref:Metallophosphoesterase n=1 Tax=Actinoplanes oblitus TaxID=3040509 RepID=A0ABY8WL81_9ACTN|nr:metallophosphoesterase [Actinoplanes oblitus]WIM96510.1 metallophosphoesterase [Actinoplanes oblitus]